MNKVLDELEFQVEAAGYIPGTPEFARRLRAAKVTKCQEMQRVAFCSECRAFMECDLVRIHLRDYTVGGSHGKSTQD